MRWGLFLKIGLIWPELRILLMITVKDKTFVPFLTPADLSGRISELARELNHDYQHKMPLFVVVLKGAFLFAAELFKHVTIPCEITFVRLASYQNLESSGRIKQIIGLDESIEDRDVVIVEDIVDTGLTMARLVGQLKDKGARTVEVVTLLHKPEAMREPVVTRYVGFEIENRFVVGFGLDYDEQGRNLDAIYILAE